MDEFIVMESVKKKNLNKKIQEFRDNHPDYEVFNITPFTTGTAIKSYVVWRLK